MGSENSCDNAKNERNGEGEDAEAKPLTPMLLHTAHLQLQAGEEHNIVDANLSEKLERRIVGQEVEAILADKDACQDETNDRGNSESSEQQRCKQNDTEHHKEYPCGVGYECNTIHFRAQRYEKYLEFQSFS